MKRDLSKRGVETNNVGVLYAPTRAPSILGLAVCPDSSVVAVVSTGSTGLGLERWRLSGDTVQRVGLQLHYYGQLSLACGTSGLFFASVSAQGGRWFLPLKALTEAPWAEVPMNEKSTSGPPAY